MPSYDVAVVGASTAGCTAARLYAQQGARVALIERRPAPDAYKTVCTHYIQPCATPTIERLGLAPLIEARGAVRNRISLWTPYGGWIPVVEGAPYGYSVTRRTLDPILRELAAGTPGVELMAGQTAVALRGDGRITGVELEDRAHGRTSVDARLVVAADGRDSAIARLAGVPGKVRPHNRFFYWAYWRGVRPAGEESRMWLLDPDAAYTFPNEDGLTVVLVAPHRDRLPEFREDLEGAYRRSLDALPDAPDLSAATQDSKLLGKLELPNVMRPAAHRGMALAGDAALASDPLWGVGCGWAFESAAWLVDETAAAVRGEEDLDKALARYRRLHRRRLGLHHFLIADIASARTANPFERRLYRAAARDEKVRRAFEPIGARRRSPATLFRPGTMARLLLSGRPRGARR
ncbi:MAG TPA: NAD(P)/FAD-dependent oxidoreductase [Solirubrobacteraceae bacterium]|nr:NAD(P)/FAD-dependent oxidoreductase [Solirubrobacteraceae bacterium]